MFSTRRALDLSNISKNWYSVGQRLAYTAVSIEDSVDWSALVRRLATPIEGAINGNGEGDKVGSFVQRLEVVTSDFVEHRQSTLIRILSLCPNLRCLSISNFDVFDRGTLLTLNSTFIMELHEALLPVCHSVRFLALALHMDQSASQRLMNTITIFRELRCLYMYENVDFDMDLELVVRFDVGYLPHLHTVGIDCGWGGNFPFWRAVGKWLTPSLKTIILGGDASMQSVKGFWGQNEAEVTDVVVDSTGALSDFSLEVGGAVERIQVPWRRAKLDHFAGYSSISSVYLAGRFDDEGIMEDTQAEMGLLRRVLSDLLRLNDFPSLEFVCFLDMEVSDVINSAWVIGDMVCWMRWKTEFEKNGVEFLDEYFRPMEMPFALEM